MQAPSKKPAGVFDNGIKKGEFKVEGNPKQSALLIVPFSKKPPVVRT
jgi:hypothetical protein